MSSKNNFITVLGQANQKPIVMLLNKLDGSISKFITIEPMVSTTAAPVYTTQAAVYLDEQENFDGKSYVYVGFTRNNDMHLIRILNANPVTIDWNFYNPGTNQKPQHFTPSPLENDFMFMIGQKDSLGTIIKFTRRTAKLQFIA